MNDKSTKLQKSTPRVTAHEKSLVDSGGARKSFRMSAESLRSMKNIQVTMGLKSETDAVEHALRLAEKMLALTHQNA